MLPLPLDQILIFIKVRNVLRVVVIAGFYGCVALALSRWIWSEHAVVHMPSYILLMALVGLAATAGGLLLRIARCPACGRFFAVSAATGKRNNFTSQCMNCGLRLDGVNARDYARRSEESREEKS
jgi:hypothetical protein